MALTSQMARSTRGGRLYTSRRGRRKIRRGRRIVGVIALVALVAVVSVWWMGDEPAPASATDHTSPPTDSRDPAGTIAGTTGLPTPLPAGGASPEIRFNDQSPADTGAASPDVLTMGSVPPADEPRQPPLPPTDIPTGASTSGAVAALMTDAEDALAANDPLVARLLLNRALHHPRATDADRAVLRDRLTTINEELLFSPRIIEGDPLTERYVIKPGDSLAKITAAQNLNVDWRLIQRVNRISDPRRIRVGQTIKVVRGPFDAVIVKGEFRLDVYARLGDSASPDARVYVRSFPVGLGQFDSTPVGEWIVRPNSKLINPPWTNPRTGQRFSADNPDNPIGERWIGLEGTDEDTTALSGYGLHGTIDPASVGTEASMGCVRLLAEDVDLLYELLVEGQSLIRVTP